MRYLKFICVGILCLGVACVFFFRNARRVDAIQDALLETGTKRVRIDRGSRFLPAELYIFERLQKIRNMGYVPVWKNHKYILRDSASGKEVDPFLWEGNWLRRIRWLRGDQSIYFGGAASNGNTVLFCDLHDIPEPWLFGLYYSKIYASRLVVRDDKFLGGEPLRKNDQEISFEQIVVRNAAMIFNWESNYPIPHERLALGEGDLRDYGFIMKKGKRCYLPVNLESGKQLTLTAEPIIVDLALGRINSLSREHGIDFSNKERLVQTVAEHSMYRSPELKAITAIELLNLYGVDIRFNKTIGQWEIAK